MFGNRKIKRRTMRKTARLMKRNNRMARRFSRSGGKRM